MKLTALIEGPNHVCSRYRIEAFAWALAERGMQLEKGIQKVMDEKGYPLYWTRVGSMASLFFSPDPVTDWHTAAKSDREAFKRFFWGMLDRGFYLAPSPFEALFLSAAHTEEDIEQTVENGSQVLDEVFSGKAGLPHE